MYASIRHKYYWPHMAIDDYRNVRDCHECTRSNPFREHWSPGQMLTAKFPIGICRYGHRRTSFADAKWPTVCTGHDGLLHNVEEKSPDVRYDCPTYSVIILDSWIVLYEIPEYILTNNWPQFFSNFFDSLCAFICTIRLATTTYPQQTSRKAERL